MPWIDSHQAWFWWLAAASLVMLIASPLVVGWLVVRLPSDYFASSNRRRLAYWDQHAAIRWGIRGAKNLLGVVLIAAGIVMLFVPGQGLLTIFAGILLVDFPGKYQLECWFVMRPKVWRSLNWLRQRARREPFTSPE